MDELKNKIVVVAVGGNALMRENQKGTLEEQAANVEECTKELAQIIEGGYQLVLTHGNGPQIGLIMLRDASPFAVKPPMPLYIYNAETQGQIGYQLMASLNNRLIKAGRSSSITAMLTQVVVDSKDPDFQKPTKPIGPFYTKEGMDNLQKELSFPYVEDSGRGYRKVVCSPRPVEIVEARIVKGLTALGLSVISAGGGGIPVVRGEDGTLRGVEAVIDKDFTSAMLAADIDAGTLMILTGVEKVAINFNKRGMQFIDTMTLEEARNYMAEGQFPPGSMGPKVEATMQYVKRCGGRAIITKLDKAVDALKGKTGTLIRP
jgi:carbamate kinase